MLPHAYCFAFLLLRSVILSELVALFRTFIPHLHCFFPPEFVLLCDKKVLNLSSCLSIAEASMLFCI